MPSSPVRVVHILRSLESAGLQRRVLSLIRELPQYSHTLIYGSDARSELFDSYAALCRMVRVPQKRHDSFGKGDSDNHSTLDVTP